MGGDGGTIPKRKDRVKTKLKSHPKSKYNIEGDRDPLERWKWCPISGLPIRRPVMSGQWGHILSKEGVIEYLLKKRDDTLESYHIQEDTSPVCDSLHKMSDLTELKLKDNTALADSSLPSEEKYHMGNFVCPITGLETNGKYKFVFSWKCGCVISERALKQCDKGPQMEVKKCLVCEKPYEPFDLVLINPVTVKELKENQVKFMARKMIPWHRKRTGGQPEGDTSSSDSDFPLEEFRSSRSSGRTPSDSSSQKPSSSPKPGSSSSPSKRARSPTPSDGPSTSGVSKRNK